MSDIDCLPMSGPELMAEMKPGEFRIIRCAQEMIEPHIWAAADGKILAVLVKEIDGKVSARLVVSLEVAKNFVTELQGAIEHVEGRVSTKVDS